MTREATAIRDFVQAHGIPQPALARAYGCSQPAISQFLSGKRPIPDIARMVAAISKVMGGVVRLEVELLCRDGEIKDYLIYVTHRVPEPDPEETD